MFNLHNFWAFVFYSARLLLIIILRFAYYRTIAKQLAEKLMKSFEVAILFDCLQQYKDNEYTFIRG